MQGSLTAGLPRQTRLPWRHDRPRHRRRHDRRDRPARLDRRQHRRPRLSRVPPALPARGLGGARPGRDLGGGAGRLRPGARRGRGADGDRHHQPARDPGAVGPRDAGLADEGHRLAGPAHRRHLRPAARGRPRGGGRAAHRPAPGPLLHRHQAHLGQGQRTARLGRRHRRAHGGGHGGLLRHRTADAGHVAHHRRQQRQPNAAIQPRDRRLGRLAVRAVRGPPRRPAGDRRVLRRGRHHRPGLLLRPVDPDRGHRRRPAGRALRPGLLLPRVEQVHLRHWLLRARQHRRRAGALPVRAPRW